MLLDSFDESHCFAPTTQTSGTKLEKYRYVEPTIVKTWRACNLKIGRDVGEERRFFNSLGHCWIREAIPHRGSKTCIWVLFFQSFKVCRICKFDNVTLWGGYETFHKLMVSNYVGKLG